MNLKKLPPEWKQITDCDGVKLLQWTSHPSMHHHFYFTNPTVNGDSTQGYFVSYRYRYPNLFRIDLASGELMQLTDRVDINPFSPSPSRVAPWIYYSAGSAVHAVSTLNGEEREVCRLNSPQLGNCSLSWDGKWLAIGARYPERCELILVDLETDRSEVLLEAAEVGHIQFCPTDSNLMIYSGTATQRIWRVDRRSPKPVWLYEQKENEWIVHESWLGSGDEVIFPHWPHALKSIRKDGKGLRTVASINAWHVCSNARGSSLVCDTNHPDRGLLQIDPVSGVWKVLCKPQATQKGTQWVHSIPAKGAGIDTSILRSSTPAEDLAPTPDMPASTYGPQWSHPHPSFSPDDSRIIFTSDREGWSQVYSVGLDPT